MVDRCSHCNWRPHPGRCFSIAVLITAVAAFPLLLVGCGGAPSTTTSTTTTDETTSDTNAPISSKGTLSGKVSDSRSTRDSVDAADGDAAGQTLPMTVDTALVSVSFEDLEGNPLIASDGTSYPPVSTDENGVFTVTGLPVGIDFVVAVDLDGDGNPDVSQIVQIPAEEGGSEGKIEDVVVDPLSTLVVAKLRSILIHSGIKPRGLRISATAIVKRLVDAYIHLFEETGVDRTLTLDDIASLDDATLEALFESLIPPAVRAGFETVQGNLALEAAGELEEAVHAAAEVFVRAGFPIVDDPGGFDLSFLGDLPDIEVKSFDELMGPPPDEMLPKDDMPSPDVLTPAQFEGPIGDILGDEFESFDDFMGLFDPDGEFDGEYDGEFVDEFVDGFGDEFHPDDPAPPFSGGEPPSVYVSTVSEPDRNFVSDQDFEDEGGMHYLPFLHEHILTRMAELHLAGRRITLRSLYRMLTDPDLGLGARLTYMVPTFGHRGPPPMVFETEDGSGTERDLEALMFSLRFSGLDDPSTDIRDIEAKEDALRQMLRELLEGTIPPGFDRLFGAFVSERIESVDHLFRFIREAKAHLPFSRSGPATFYVVADGDPFSPDGPATVNPVTVDVEFDEHDLPARVVYNASGTGAFFLRFTHATEEHHIVELLVRETGRPLHGAHGKLAFLDMGDEHIFAPIDGKPFLDFIAASGTFWPGIPVNVPNPDFHFGMDTFEPKDDYEIHAADYEPEPGPTVHLYVLATRPGPDGEPVKVDYSIADGTLTYNPNGRYYVAFLPETPDEGVFGLYDANLNFMATAHDLTSDGFIEAPSDFGFVDTNEPFPPDEVFPEFEGELPPLDGDIPFDELFPPPDGEVPLTDGTDTSTDSTDTPPDSDIQPAEDTTTSTDDTTATDATTEPTTGDEEVPLDGEDTTTTDEQFPPFEEEPPPPPMGGIPPYEMEMARIHASEIIGIEIKPEFFEFVFGTEVPNGSFDPEGNPYFDDASGNGVEDAGEFTSDYRPTLFDPRDWRATDIARYYRRVSGGAVTNADIDFEATEPRTRDGEALVPRRFLPRLNAFRFGRPNSAINLLTTFMPPEAFNGTRALDGETKLGIFQAIATVNLVMEQVFNVEARIDIDGEGPLPETTELIDAHLFVMPIGDPFTLMLKGFERLSELSDND